MHFGIREFLYSTDFTKFMLFYSLEPSILWVKVLVKTSHEAFVLQHRIKRTTCVAIVERVEYECVAANERENTVFHIPSIKTYNSRQHMFALILVFENLNVVWYLYVLQ